MEQMAKKRVPVTDEEKQKSYYKYFEQEMDTAVSGSIRKNAERLAAPGSGITV